MTETKDWSEKWAVENWFLHGHRIMDTAPEGSNKTLLGLWLVICIATGTPFLGQQVKQGSVVIIDEETPYPSLTSHLSRFALSVGCKDWRELPITVKSMEGFRFGRKTELDKLLKLVYDIKPVMLRMDSVVAMLPGARKGLSENDSGIGVAIKDDLNKIKQFVDIISISAHAKKAMCECSWKELKTKEMQSIVRGSGSIVGEGCDTGLVIRKISEYPLPSRFVISTRARRQAVPLANKDIYVEIKEEAYGEGWMKLERISPVALPASSIACVLFELFKEQSDKEWSQKQLRQEAAFYTLNDLRDAITELKDRRVILNGKNSLNYHLNEKWEVEVSESYRKSLYPEKVQAGGVV